MDVFQNMTLFSEMIRCGGDIYTWCYDADGKLLKSNCPDAGFLSGVFDLFGCRKKNAGLRQAARNACHARHSLGYDMGGGV